MSWWDAVRMAWFYWFGLVRFLLVFVGWIWGLLRLGVGLLWRTLKNLVTSPFAMLDSSSRQPGVPRSEEHTSELQSPCNLVCRLLLEKKKKNSSRCEVCIVSD